MKRQQSIGVSGRLKPTSQHRPVVECRPVSERRPLDSRYRRRGKSRSHCGSGFSKQGNSPGLSFSLFVPGFSPQQLQYSSYQCPNPRRSLTGVALPHSSNRAIPPSCLPQSSVQASSPFSRKQHSSSYQRPNPRRSLRRVRLRWVRNTWGKPSGWRVPRPSHVRSPPWHVWEQRGPPAATEPSTQQPPLPPSRQPLEANSKRKSENTRRESRQIGPKRVLLREPRVRAMAYLPTQGKRGGRRVSSAAGEGPSCGSQSSCTLCTLGIGAARGTRARHVSSRTSSGLSTDSTLVRRSHSPDHTHSHSHSQSPSQSHSKSQSESLRATCHQGPPHVSHR